MGTGSSPVTHFLDIPRFGMNRAPGRAAVLNTGRARGSDGGRGAPEENTVSGTGSARSANVCGKGRLEQRVDTEPTHRKRVGRLSRRCVCAVRGTERYAAALAPSSRRDTGNSYWLQRRYVGGAPARHSLGRTRGMSADCARRAHAVNPSASLRGPALRALTALRSSQIGGYAPGGVGASLSPEMRAWAKPYNSLRATTTNLTPLGSPGLSRRPTWWRSRGSSQPSLCC